MNIRIPLAWFDRLQRRLGFRVFVLTGEPRETYGVYEAPIVGLRFVAGGEVRAYYGCYTEKYGHRGARRAGMDA